MPESVELGDRFWLVRSIGELEGTARARASRKLDRVNVFYQRNEMEKVWDAAVPLIETVLVEDEVSEMDIRELDVSELAQILDAISDDTISIQ